MVQSMQGSPAHVIAEDFGFSESTARRRIQEARDSVRDELALHVDDGAEVPYETVTDPVLSRSQRLFEETFAASLSPEPGRGRDRCDRSRARSTWELKIPVEQVSSARSSEVTTTATCARSPTAARS